MKWSSRRSGEVYFNMIGIIHIMNVSRSFEELFLLLCPARARTIRFRREISSSYLTLSSLSSNDLYPRPVVVIDDANDSGTISFSFDWFMNFLYIRTTFNFGDGYKWNHFSRSPSFSFHWSGRRSNEPVKSRRIRVDDVIN